MLTSAYLQPYLSIETAVRNRCVEKEAVYHCNDLFVVSSSTMLPQRPSSSDIISKPSGLNVVTEAVNALFSYKPFFDYAAGRARNMIVERGTVIGHPWAPELAKLHLHDWVSEFDCVNNSSLSYPEYYLKPFHAYEAGNLSWDAALEVELAAKSVHANVFDPERKKLDANGDQMMRDSYHEKILSMLKERPENIVDIGCATGLSTFGLYKTFPGCNVIGVDLSPFFLSVANYRLKEIQEGLDKTISVQFLHTAGEYTGLPSEAFDLISLSSVCHELPREATKLIIEEAHRLLKSGGALAIMEMNPYSPYVQKMFNNIFAFTAFKSTEPYFDDYRTFYVEGAIEERGFTFPKQLESSPRHRTIVSFKK